jgi:putative ABC transport system ATP-binding protein
MIMISLQNVVKTYPMGKSDLTVLKGVSLDVEKGEMIAIMGPSGSGKTTLLNIVGCLDRQTSGKYLFEGKDISGFTSGEFAELRGQKIGFIFQTFNLLSRLSALSNVELGMMYAGGVNRQRAREALEKVGLGARIKHRPIELSGGEQQRVAIARALVKEPSVFLADEPTGQLDSRSGQEVMSILGSLNTEHGITVIMVTHDSAVAHKCQRIVHIRDGEIESEEKV